MVHRGVSDLSHSKPEQAQTHAVGIPWLWGKLSQVRNQAVTEESCRELVPGTCHVRICVFI